MSDLPHILKLSDFFSQRAAALRLSEEDDSLPLSHLLARYLKCLDGPDLLGREAVSRESLVSLQSLQDLVYGCDDLGRLTGIYPGVCFRQGEARIELSEVPWHSEIVVDGSSARVTEIVIDRTDAGYAGTGPAFTAGGGTMILSSSKISCAIPWKQTSGLKGPGKSFSLTSMRVN